METQPKRWNWKKIGCLVLVIPFGLLAALVALGMVIEANMSPEEKAQREAAREAERAQAAAKDAADTAKRDAQNAEVIRTAFQRIALPCDAAQLMVGEGLSNIAGGNRIALAKAVTQMESRCGSAWLAIRDIEMPEDLTSAQEDLADQMMEQCRTAFWLRKELAEKLIPVVDGDMRPSVIAGLSADMEEMRGAVAQCNATLDALAPAAPASAE